MSSTILSSLGEAVLHRNSLATITDNWIVVREAKSHRQILLAIDSIASIRAFKTLKLHYVASALGSLVLAAAAAASKEPYGITVPFALIGLAFLISAQVTRRASVAFIADGDLICTDYGTLPEAATLVTAIRSARAGQRWGDRPAYELFLWWRAYLTLLV